MPGKVNTLDTLEEIRKVNSSFLYSDPIRDWKSNGGKIIGFMCTYVPEEIIHAAGMLPIRITGYDSHELPLEDASAYFGLTSCSFIRHCFQLGLEGKFSYLDGFVAPLTCEGTRYLIDLWCEYIPIKFNHLIILPRKWGPWGDQLYLEELTKFKRHLEESFNVEISNKSLRASIGLYNESRKLLHQIYELRKSDSPPISGAEVIEVINASGRMPRERYNELLRQLVAELKATTISHQGRVRLMTSGSILNNPEFVKAIEELGGLVVAEEVCEGVRYFWDLVDADGNASPLELLARRYFRKFPCAHIIDCDGPEGRPERTIALAKEFRADGVVSQIIRYCNSYIVQEPVFRDILEKQGIPILELDVEYAMPATGQVRTRVLAFIEMLEHRRARR